MPAKRVVRLQKIKKDTKKKSFCTEDFPKIFANYVDLSFDGLNDDQNKQFLISDHRELYNHIEEKKILLHQILNYIDYSDNLEENFQSLESILEKYKLSDNKFDIKLLLLMLVKISNNHYHMENFY